MIRKTVILLFGLFFIIGFAGAQTAATGDWIVYTDNTEGGNSTLNMTMGTETIGGVQVRTYTFTGTVARGVQWPYAGVTFEPDAATLTAIRNGRGLSFKIVGNGRALLLQAVLPSLVKDFCQFQFQVATRNNRESAVTVNYTQLRQADWGVQVRFDANAITAFNFVADTVGAVNFKIYDLQILQ
jgi:hypothetical protein